VGPVAVRTDGTRIWQTGDEMKVGNWVKHRQDKDIGQEVMLSRWNKQVSSWWGQSKSQARGGQTTRSTGCIRPVKAISCWTCTAKGTQIFYVIYIHLDAHYFKNLYIIIIQHITTIITIISKFKKKQWYFYI